MNSINVLEYLQSPFWIIQFVIFSALCLGSFSKEKLSKSSLTIHFVKALLTAALYISFVLIFMRLQSESLIIFDRSDPRSLKYIAETDALYFSLAMISFFMFGRFGFIHGLIGFLISVLTTVMFGIATWPFGSIK